jgi:hypothetical protein
MMPALSTEASESLLARVGVVGPQQNRIGPFTRISIGVVGGSKVGVGTE